MNYFEQSYINISEDCVTIRSTVELILVKPERAETVIFIKLLLSLSALWSSVTVMIMIVFSPQTLNSSHDQTFLFY